MEKGLFIFVITVLVIGAFLSVRNVSVKHTSVEPVSNDTTTLTPTITLPPLQIIRHGDDE